MYNKEVKQMFMDSVLFGEHIIKYAQRQFDRVAEEEEFLGKDLCNFSIIEIITYYKKLNSTSVSTLENINILFRRYTGYCLMNNLVEDSQNHYDEMDFKNLNTCVTPLMKYSYVSREELLKRLNSVENYQDKYIVLGLFEGILGAQLEDLMNVKAEDYYDGVLHLKSGKQLEISSELQEIIQASCETYEYTASKNGKIKIYKMDESCKLCIKNKINRQTDAASMYKNVRATIDKLKDVLDLPNISAKNIYEMGRIDMILKLAKQDNITPEKAFFKYRDTIEQRYGRIASFQRYMTKYQDLMG